MSDFRLCGEKERNVALQLQQRGRYIRFPRTCHRHRSCHQLESHHLVITTGINLKSIEKNLQRSRYIRIQGRVILLVIVIFFVIGLILLHIIIIEYCGTSMNEKQVLQKMTTVSILHNCCLALH